MSDLTSAGSTAIFNEPTASLFHSARTEVIIDRPAADVWAILSDLSYPTVKLWNPQVLTNERVSGKAGQENEVIFSKKDTQQAPFYMRTIRVVPYRQRVLRIEAIDGSFAAFVDHTLHEEGGRTRLVYSGYIETRRVPVDQVKSFDRETAEREMMDYLNHTHGLLKKVVEESPRAK